MSETTDLLIEVLESEIHDDDCDLADGCRCSGSARKYRLGQATRIARAIEDSGLAVVKLPEPDDWVDAVTDDGEDTRTPYWRTSWGESVTAWIEGVEASAWELQEDLNKIRDDASKMLAAVAECERFRARQQGGDRK